MQNMSRNWCVPNKIQNLTILYVEGRILFLTTAIDFEFQHNSGYLSGSNSKRLNVKICGG